MRKLLLLTVLVLATCAAHEAQAQSKCPPEKWTSYSDMQGTSVTVCRADGERAPDGFVAVAQFEYLPKVQQTAVILPPSHQERMAESTMLERYRRERAAVTLLGFVLGLVVLVLARRAIARVALLALLVGLSSVPAEEAQAQETYTLSYGAAPVARLNRTRAAINVQTCKRLGLADACTQAEACTAAGAAGGASCSDAQAVAANARIYPDTQAGREELVTQLALQSFRAIERALLTEPEARGVCQWFTNTATAQQRSDFCTTAGQPADCMPCP